MAQKKGSKQKKAFKGVVPIIIIVGIIAILLFIQYSVQPEKVAATVNGEIITQKQIDTAFARLPEEYKVALTMEQVLERTINTRLLIQEAAKQNITVSEEEINTELDRVRTDNFNSEEEFQKFLSDNGLIMANLRTQIKEQFLINKLIQTAILSKLEVPDERVQSFYEQNQVVFGNLTFDEVKDQIKQTFQADMAASAVNTYIAQLRVQSEITIYGQELTVDIQPPTTVSFLETGDDICTDAQGLPSIRFYTKPNCTACSWIEGTLDSVASEYNLTVKKIDLGEKVPISEFELIKEYFPNGMSVPSFNFGCAYTRMGNAYLSVEEEAAQFKLVLDTLLE